MIKVFAVKTKGCFGDKWEGEHTEVQGLCQSPEFQHSESSRRGADCARGTLNDLLISPNNLASGLPT